ncbi:MAG TPA: YopX family protein [Ohtaekwangia sp.]|nr:YopX family protein [Ohtaekwangia sp.]
MREIKFRVWDNVDYMSTPFTLQDLQSKKIQFTSDCVVMQCTGLKDKNGKEIYEGDIFRVEEDGAEDGTDMIYYLVIVWVKEWCMFCTLRVSDEYPGYLSYGLKVLDEPMFWTYTLEDTNDRRFYMCGNIYENPELLK